MKYNPHDVVDLIESYLHGPGNVVGSMRKEYVRATDDVLYIQKQRERISLWRTVALLSVALALFAVSLMLGGR